MNLELSVRRIQSTVFALVVFFGAILVSTPSVGASKTQSKSAVYVVRYKSNVDFAKVLAPEIKRGIKPTAIYTSLFPGFSARLTPAQSKRLRNDRRVASVSEVRSYSVPSAPALISTKYVWGLDRINQRQLPLDNASANTFSGTGVDVYVVDSGVDGTHPEFSGRLSSEGFSALSGFRADNDCNGHGTHVAGTIAGESVGVARGATIIPVRVFPCTGGARTDTILKGIDFVIAHHQRGVPAVANLSLGGPVDAALDFGIRALVADGVSVVVAAGNSSIDACRVSPARERSAITVGASTRSDARASFSNFGSCLDVFAPGQDVLSAWPGSRYALLKGTSMASPYVAGVAALRLQANPTLSPSQVESLIRQSSTKDVLSSIGNRSPNSLLYSGSDSGTSLPTPSLPVPTTLPVQGSVPGQIDTLYITAQLGQALVKWAPVSNDGGSPILDYRIEYRLGQSGVWSSFQDGVSPLNMATVTGLATTGQYFFRVSAVNAAGAGPWTSGSVLLGMITSDYFSLTPGSRAISTLTLSSGGLTWVWYEVTLVDPTGALPATMGGQLCPDDASYPDFNRCTGATFGRSGTGFRATYTGLFGLGSRGLWKVTFDSSSRVESPRKLIVR
jgi:subtilisin family serine protease